MASSTFFWSSADNCDGPRLKVSLSIAPVNGNGHIVVEVHRRAGVEPDVEALVGRHEERNGVLDRLAGDLLAIHAQHAGAALGEAGAVVLEVKYDGVLAFTQR